MELFSVVTLFHLQTAPELLEAIEAMAMNDFEALGIEEYSMSEAEVDALLGDRSYSGGDLPQDVLDEVDAHQAMSPCNYRFFFESHEKALAFENQVKQVYLCESQVEQSKVQDWNAEWKKHYAPIKIDSSLEIIPAWQQDYKSTSEHILFINPGMGFGTGSHETTFLCLKLFSQHLKNTSVRSVIDFGSGSGILGLATLKFFPNAKVDFYDIDLEANKNCYHNAEINDLEDKNFRLLLPEVRECLNSKYDVVFANILENILILEKEELIRYVAPGGSLILSGLLKHQVDGIVNAYSGEALHLVERVDKGDWSALIFKKEG